MQTHFLLLKVYFYYSMPIWSYIYIFLFLSLVAMRTNELLCSIWWVVFWFCGLGKKRNRFHKTHFMFLFKTRPRSIGMRRDPLMFVTHVAFALAFLSCSCIVMSMSFFPWHPMCHGWALPDIGGRAHKWGFCKIQLLVKVIYHWTLASGLWWLHQVEPTVVLLLFF